MKDTLRQKLTKLFRYLLQGVAVTAPIAVTLYFIIWLFNVIDGILPNFIQSLLGNKLQFWYRIPGIGFLIIMLLLILIGRFSSSFLFKGLLSFVENIMTKTPGIKLVYASINDFIKSFSGSKKKFDTPILVSVDAPDVWRIGFITQEEAKSLDMCTHVVVYVPHAYAISGITYIVPKDKVKPIKEKMTSTEAMRFTVSGGISDAKAE